MTDTGSTAYTAAEQVKASPVQSFRAAWTHERVDRLAALIKSGMTASQAAAELGGGLTRNAIIGICKRRGIPLNGRSGDNMRQVPRPPRQRRARFAKRMFPELPVVPLPPTPVRPVQPTCAPIGLLELTNETCRWPLGEPVSDFCGALEADNRNGVVYCPSHRRMAYRRPGEVEA